MSDDEREDEPPLGGRAMLEYMRRKRRQARQQSGPRQEYITNADLHAHGTKYWTLTVTRLSRVYLSILRKVNGVLQRTMEWRDVVHFEETHKAMILEDQRLEAVVDAVGDDFVRMLVGCTITTRLEPVMNREGTKQLKDKHGNLRWQRVIEVGDSVSEPVNEAPPRVREPGDDDEPDDDAQPRTSTDGGEDIPF